MTSLIEEIRKQRASIVPATGTAGNHNYATIEGTVMGYLDENYTRGLKGVYAILAAHWVDGRGEHVYQLTADGMNGLQNERPDIYQAVTFHSESFRPKPSGNDGEFRFDSIPVGDWNYIAMACVDTNPPRQHTEFLGNDGRNGRNVIPGYDLKRDGKRKEIIIPVRDVWFEECIAEPKTDDPPWKPEYFKPGINLGDRDI